MTLNDTDGLPFFSISNKELADLPEVEGETVICEVCGERHKIEYGLKKLDNGELVPSKTLGFVSCGEDKYLVSMHGKRITF